MNPEHVTFSFRVTAAAHGAHVTAAHERAHDTETLDCWCGPSIARVCDECAGSDGCWKCERGLIHITRNEAEMIDEPLIIGHR